MAEHNWKQLLDDPEIEGIVARAYKGPGHRYYGTTRNSLALDDLESWLWDCAVKVAENYPGAPPNAYDPRGHFRAHLYQSLAKAIMGGWHYSEFAGKRDSSRRAAMTTITSFDLELEGGGRHVEESASLAVHRRLRSNDPLAILLHIERAQDLLDRAEHQAAAGAFVAESSPYCSENLCLQPTHAGGLCAKHYYQQRRAWGGTCSVEGCTNGVQSKGLCPTHYSAARRARTDAPTCKHEGCTSKVKARGLCSVHYNANAETWAAERAAKPTTCTHPGCAKPPQSRGMCNTHYCQDRYQGRKHHR